MDILVKFDGIKWKVFPDPAIVPQGELIVWKFETSNLNSPSVRWTTYFEKASPFGAQGNRFTTTTRISAGRHIGATGAMSADDPGDYKYGVRADDASTQTPIGDDDPTLKVVANSLFYPAVR